MGKNNVIGNQKNHIEHSKKVDENFLEKEARKVSTEDLEKVLDNKKSIFVKLKKNKAISKYLELAKTMFQMVKDTKKGIYKQVPWFTIATIIVVLLYILNPLDIIPDFVPGLGYLDDASIFALALQWIRKDIDAYLSWRDTVDFTEEE